MKFRCIVIFQLISGVFPCSDLLLQWFIVWLVLDALFRFLCTMITSHTPLFQYHSRVMPYPILRWSQDNIGMLPLIHQPIKVMWPADPHVHSSCLILIRLCHSFSFTHGAVLKGPMVLGMVTKIRHWQLLHTHTAVLQVLMGISHGQEQPCCWDIFS